MSTIKAGNSATTTLLTTPDTSGNLTFVADNQLITVNTTGSLNIPAGTTAQRPSSPINGMLRYNNSISQVEVYVYGAWANVNTTAYTYTASYLIVAGGGSGGGYEGGGGAGGFVTGTTTLTGGTVYTATVGAGGTSIAGPGNGSTRGNNGGNSSFT